jgi:hypothetical protein
MTAASLEKRLRFQMDCSTIRWKDPKTERFASVVADKGLKAIDLPPGYDDFYTLRTLFHELCHVAVPGELAAFGKFEEDVLERVMEPGLMAYVLARPRVHEWWLRKLRESGWVDALNKKRKGDK